VIENLYSVNVFSPSISEIVINVLLSTVCSFVITLIYRFTYRGPVYSNSFINSLIFLSAITALVIMVIGNNLARAFGLVGALSIIRFRTAIKDTMDIVYVFLALAIGMASGVGYHKLAITGTILLGIILLVFSKDKFSSFITDQYMLQFAYSNEKSEENAFQSILSGYCSNYEVINIRSNEINKMFEYSYYIRIKRNKDANQMLYDLQKLDGVSNINLFFDKQNS
jgi:uncharacterized membrane protein YhiD involved in acid resistance